MIDLHFLKALRNKLKGGNSKSIHLNVLPGRFVARLDLANLNHIHEALSRNFLNTLLTQAHFEFTISFDGIDLNTISTEEQKQLGLLSKRLNSIAIENEDNYKEHGIKTFGFGYPILIKPFKQDPTKIIKAPLFVWQLEIIKSSKKVNTWSILRNKTKNESGRIVDEEIHSVNLNEVLLTHLKTDEGIAISQINEELLEDALIDKDELFAECYKVIQSLNTNSTPDLEEYFSTKFEDQINNIPEATYFDSIGNPNPYIYFGGVFGLFKTQKESIITDIDKLIDKFDLFDFENLKGSDVLSAPFSAIDTDPSQQEILNTLNLQPKKIIQGPPGTGKSQSLTALITNALSNNLKCLVVCEKKTALEVIKSNLIRENSQLGNLAAVIEDISKDRDPIINSVRERINNTDQVIYFNERSYDTLKEEVSKSAEVINDQHKLLDKKIYQGKSWTELVGEFLKRKRTSDYKLLQNRLEHKWFAFAPDNNEMEQISNSLKNAKRYYEKINSLHHPLELLHNDVFLSSNLSSTQLKLENIINTFQSDFPSLVKSIVEHKEKSDRWKSHNYAAYSPYVKGTVRKWVHYIMGETDKEPFPKPPILDEEQLAKVHLLQLEQLEISLNHSILNYHSWLRDHYRDYHASLENSIEKYQKFIAENETVYGNKFLKNGSLRRFFTSLRSIVSVKNKTLKKNRRYVVDQIQDIRSAHLAYDYIEHEYISEDHLNDLHAIVQNVDELKVKNIEWYQTVPQKIEEYLGKISSKQLHKTYEHKNSLLDVETKAIQFIDETSTQFELYPQAPSMDNLHDILNTISVYKKDLDSILNEYEEFHVFYTVHSLAYSSIIHDLNSITAPFKKENILKSSLTDENSLERHFLQIKDIENQVIIIKENLEAFRDYYNWRTYFNDQTPLNQKVIKAVIDSGCTHWNSTFECWYLHWLLSSHDNRDLPNSENNILEFIKTKADLRNAQIKSILHYWKGRQKNSLHRLSEMGMSPSSLFNKRGSKGEKRHSIRKIIKTDFELFTDFYPVMMVSPSVCSSILPLKEGIFDIVIFDEASQLRLEDTFPALLRGKIRLVSGDSQQMPPSSYFQGGNAILTPTEEEIEDGEETLELPPISKIHNSLDLAESESLLVYAENSNYKQSYLKIHYRSQHPHLIDFSNHAFYGKRLIPMPFKMAYKCIQFIEVNGLYEEQVNKDEARQVVDILLNHIKPLKNGSYPSVGVATFNLYQRNLIHEEIIKARQQSEDNDKKLNDLGTDLFVKNLENIQGDERDIIIISTTFGRRADNSFSQHFGPIIQPRGYKLLNVLITRAKIKVYVCTSIPSESIRSYSGLLQQHRNNGRAIFYAYLAYAKAVSDNNIDQIHSILNQLYDNCDAKEFNIEHDALGSESPFEEEVYYRLSEKIGQSRLQQQYAIGGFRIDLIIKSEITGKPSIALECDGAKYHSSNEAYSWDMFRQHRLEEYGFIFYRIWSTNWWHSLENELKKLVEFIHAEDLKERNSRVPESDTILSEEIIVPITTQNENKVKVKFGSIVTVKTAEGEIFKVKFSRDERNMKKQDEQGVKIVYERAPLAIALHGRTEGEICQLGMLEVFYEILRIE